ncbi:hypothetical protein N8743_03225 [Candidatus Pelagibacter ubique]|nr:hypothetical protein [Candidatus Pelagibacter ubique]
MKTLPKDQYKYKLTTSVDRIPLEILKKKLSETNTPLSSFINKIIIYTSNSNMKPHQLMINK